MQEAAVAISARGLSKVYHLWESPGARLQSAALRGAGRLLPAGAPLRTSLERRARAGSREFPALQPLDFEIRRGEAVGIVGRNGSGKSTLLQLIAGILQPTAGSIRAGGRISALLELGSGFNPDFTGRENVYLNGSILGLSAREMDRRYDAIVAFADIGEFIHEPVKTYSSGMMMRLAFAVAVSVRPDILIVDEALSVGDVFFTQKCFGRIREILDGGATLVFVSHDLAAVQNLCSRALLLHKGHLVFDGRPDECVSRYFALEAPELSPAARDAAVSAGLHPPVDPAARAALVARDLLPGARSRVGDRRLELVAAGFTNDEGQPALAVGLMGSATLRVLLRANEPVTAPAVGLQLFDRMANLAFAAGTPQRRFHLPALAAGEEVMLDFRLQCTLQAGEYTLGLDAASLSASDPDAGIFHDRIGGLGPLTIHHQPGGVRPFYGFAHVPLEIRYA